MATLDELSAAYDAADVAFLSAVRDGQPRPELARLAAKAASLAGDWEAAAHRKFFELRKERGGEDRTVIEIEIQAEKAEVLSELMAELAEALQAESG